MPDALWFGLTFGVFNAAFFLALGYVHGDAKRRDMPAWAWVAAAFLIPNLIGFILYFVFRRPLLGPANPAARPFAGEKHSVATAEAPRVPASEDSMERERALQIVLVVVGLFYCFWGYLLFHALWHSRWLGHSDVMPMFLSLNAALGLCLLLAARQPARHRLMIAYGA